MESSAETFTVNPWMILPFALLLAMIALAPFLFAKFWHRHYPKVAVILGAVVIGYYVAGLHATTRVGETAHEYIGFIALIGSLFVVSGGIHIVVRGRATPFGNVLFLLVGAVLANLLGTTGAAMLLIRPWLRLNHYRVAAHHVVFFILIVANVGGCLTPIGDPPLFLGYLMGVPFGWVMLHCLPMWSLGVAILLVMFFVVDRLQLNRLPAEIRASKPDHEHWKFEGLLNIIFLAIIIGAVFIHDPPFLREGLMIAAAAGSYFTTRKHVHAANHFNLEPIKEVAILFIGIFATMMPALDWLQNNAGRLQDASPGLFFWGCGTLSSVLDNAPTYLCFMKASFGRFVDADSVTQIAQLVHTHGTSLASVTGPHAEAIKHAFAAFQQYYPGDVQQGLASMDKIRVAYLLSDPQLNDFIVAISVSAVFFGANTYIGNGPNFMVKAIADQQKIPTPSFFGYVLKYAVPFMMPMLLIVWWVFFRG